MQEVYFLALFTTFQIIFGTIFSTLITQKRNLPLCEELPVCDGNHVIQGELS